MEQSDRIIGLLSLLELPQDEESQELAAKILAMMDLKQEDFRDSFTVQTQQHAAQIDEVVQALDDMLIYSDDSNHKCDNDLDPLENAANVIIKHRMG